MKQRIVALAIAWALSFAAFAASTARTDLPNGKGPNWNIAPRGSDTSTFDETYSTSNAAWVYDKTGSVDVTNGATRVEQCQCDYETVAASQTDQVLGGAGGVGDYLQSLTIVPATTGAGAVSIKDGSGSSITVFTGGVGSVVDLKPFEVHINASSTGGAWKVTTGASVSVFAAGRFTP